MARSGFSEERRAVSVMALGRNGADPALPQRGELVGGEASSDCGGRCDGPRAGTVARSGPTAVAAVMALGRNGGQIRSAEKLRW